MAQRDDEIFDVVDERDIPVGTATRKEVHALKLRHRAVHVLVFNAAGKVFLQKRSMAKDTAPGAWDSSSSGHLDAGEEYDACAVRELREELGLVLASGIIPERVLYVEACSETGNEFVRVYRARAEGPFTLHPAEIDDGAWYDPDEITQRMATDPKRYTRAFRYIWPRFMARIR